MDYLLIDFVGNKCSSGATCPPTIDSQIYCTTNPQFYKLFLQQFIVFYAKKSTNIEYGGFTVGELVLNLALRYNNG